MSPGPADLTDINHPRGAVKDWRAEADRLEELITQHPTMPCDELKARMATLRECARQIEDRLRWSGL